MSHHHLGSITFRYSWYMVFNFLCNTNKYVPDLLYSTSDVEKDTLDAKDTIKLTYFDSLN